MTAASFAVDQAPKGFRWRVIGDCGRSLVYDGRDYPTQHEAAAAAKATREHLRTRAENIDCYREALL